MARNILRSASAFTARASQRRRLSETSSGLQFWARSNGISKKSYLVASAVGSVITGSVILHFSTIPNSASGLPNQNVLFADSSESTSWWPRQIPFIKRRSTASDGESEKKSGDQDPPSQRQVVKDEDKEDDSGVTSRLSKAAGSTTTDEWSKIPDKIADYIVPSWLKFLPGFISKLQGELSMAPGTLAWEIWDEGHNPEVHPEILWDTSVRVSETLCSDEVAFIQKRKIQTRKALAKYIGIEEKDINPNDIPTIAMCGSGGGLRALVAGCSSYLSARESGLFDCLTYTAGVSGSCWLQALYYSTLSGGQSHQQLINHLKHRLDVHIAFPPAALNLLNSAPTNKYLLSGVIEKVKGLPKAEFGIVDVYGLLLTARLFVPKGELQVDADDLKLSNQRRYIDEGQQPLPIYTAVRHEIPVEEKESTNPAAARAKAQREAWFQWFEFTPYEFWCEELGAGIPTWAMGHQFEGGRTKWRENGLALPELRISLFLGIWGSAFCATLSHYYKEIRPVLKGITGFGGVDDMMRERDQDLVKVHPIEPATIPNFAAGMQDQLPASCPESIIKNDTLQLMDAGMSNNLPIYPLLRPGRDVDVLICFDASADVKTDNWLKVVDGYARQRGIKGWPMGAGWPPEGATPGEIEKELDKAQASSEADAKKKLGDAKVDPEASKDAKASNRPQKTTALSYCNVWVGSTEERTSGEEPPQSKLVDEDMELMRPDAGITVIYFPFMKNPKVDGVDPMTSDFMSTWNFIYTPEQIDKVVQLARANFNEGNEQTKRAVRAVYERKKEKRLVKEAEERKLRRQRKLRLGQAGRKLGEGDHGDHFT
ncbi:phospholipase-like protein A2 [Aulographum hederae CBS 113979]|uniref:Lysophospholipase n=1 Tax=Aulographum hederae CBS 113979 TaxID=1176131 RepID=A0A6G1HH78_9PEZI|nr:phospholipase-like protein A2 [Aulographum hederae CBS 113979]